MQIQHVSFSSTGGAGKVAALLATYQTLEGHQSTLLSAMKGGLRDNPWIHPQTTLASAFDNFAVKKNSFPSLVSVARDRVQSFTEGFDGTSEILHFHWMNGVIKRQEIVDKLSSKTKIFWTLHDMNPFTGACHYSMDCKRFVDGCHKCPAVRFPFQLSVKTNFREKRDFLDAVRAKCEVTFVAPSKWIASLAAESEIIQGSRIVTLSQPIDPSFFDRGPSSPEEEVGFARRPLVLGMVCGDLTDPIKGVIEAVSIFKECRQEGEALFLFGANGHSLDQPSNGVFWQGKFDSTELSAQIKKLDAIILNSKFDNTPLVIAESMASGVPVIAREVGGIPEMVDDLRTGLLFNDGPDLKRAIEIFRESDSVWRQKISSNCLDHAWSNHNPNAVARRHLEAYKLI
jgi:glycosyltransferase involved in cell wall biosynthesis